jgi:hypothetical protein
MPKAAHWEGEQPRERCRNHPKCPKFEAKNCRGLCLRCRTALAKAVRAGEITLEQAEELGWLRSRKPGGFPKTELRNPMKRRIALHLAQKRIAEAEGGPDLLRQLGVDVPKDVPKEGP